MLLRLEVGEVVRGVTYKGREASPARGAMRG